MHTLSVCLPQAKPQGHRCQSQISDKLWIRKYQDWGWTSLNPHSLRFLSADSQHPLTQPAYIHIFTHLNSVLMYVPSFSSGSTEVRLNLMIFRHYTPTITTCYLTDSHSRLPAASYVFHTVYQTKDLCSCSSTSLLWFCESSRREQSLFCQI